MESCTNRVLYQAALSGQELYQEMFLHQEACPGQELYKSHRGGQQAKSSKSTNNNAVLRTNQTDGLGLFVCPAETDSCVCVVCVCFAKRKKSLYS